MNNNFKIHSVKFNFVMSMIMKISSYIFPLITIPYVTRALGATANGKISFASSVISYFLMFSQLGIPSYGIRECAKCRDNKEKLTKTVQELLIINSISTACSYIALITAMIMVPKLHEEPVLLIVQSFTIILNMIGMDWLYQAIEQYQYITVRNLIFKTLSVVLMIILVHNPQDYMLYNAITVLSASGSYVLNFINCRKFLEHKTFHGEYELRKHLKPIFIFFSMSVAVSIYTSLDTVMLGFMSTDKEVAFYSLGTKIKMVLATTVSTLGPVLLPRITYVLEKGEENKFRRYIEKSLHFVLLMALPFTVYFTIMAQNVIQILGGREYLPATLCMQIINFTIIPLGVGNIAVSQILTPKRNEIYSMYATIIGAVIDFALNWLLIRRFGAAGAAAATVVTEWAVACVQIRYAWADLKPAFKKIPHFALIVSNVVSVAALCALVKILPRMNVLIVMIITAVVYFGVYGFTLMITKDDLIIDYGVPAVKKILKR
ncbi:oligosaccharide flippase family protein [Clostridiales Family XIII bacterium RF-744-FAT-WT-3]|uniref:Oligosaccharide flippase family protein n=2 Tax=Baileyella intestinalis TaxID=2606709 RepID=A0A6A8MBX7_9FIRM|nr:oligosaccharide flippase family protein [Baileyella intestinalis]